jgi:hypothetical protein
MVQSSDRLDAARAGEDRDATQFWHVADANTAPLMVAPWSKTPVTR